MIKISYSDSEFIKLDQPSTSNSNVIKFNQRDAEIVF